MKFFNSLILLLIFICFSCDYLQPKDQEKAIARVNDVYLYKSNLEAVLPKDISSQDSTVFANNFIRDWATKQLLVNGAERNLNENKLKDFNRLVEQYKSDLYGKAYVEALVRKGIDTIVTNKEAKAYYDENKEAFKLNEDLIMFRYINLDKNRLDLKGITKKFKRYNKEDRKALDSISIQFKSYSLKDSIWIRVDQAISKIPVLNQENRDQLLKKSNFLQLKDSLGLYLMQINAVLERNSIAPLEYVKPTINQIVINKRKLEFIRQLEKDITKDAVKNKQFEIYN